MKKDILPRNSKNKAHGLWIYHFSNGNLYYKGQYINDLKHGYWLENWIYKSKVRFYIK